MVSEVGMSPDQIAQVFGALGRIESKIDGNSDTLKDHIKHDEEVTRALFGRIETLQLGQAKQKGFLTALTSVGSVLGAGIGYFVERMIRGH